jgi:hypothetical protein
MVTGVDVGQVEVLAEIDALRANMTQASPNGAPPAASPIAGHQPKGVARPISDRNLTLAYELETWRLAGCPRSTVGRRSIAGGV